jgi:hypothetical protein
VKFKIVLWALVSSFVLVGAALLLGFRSVQRSITPLEYGQVYGNPPDINQTGALVQTPHNGYFSRMPATSIKIPQGHFQHFAPARPDDDFPYQQLRQIEAHQIAAGGPPIFVTATYSGKSRPVYFGLHMLPDANNRPTTKPSWWSQAVNLRDEAFIHFFADSYVRKRMFQPPAQNYWLGVDNCIFSIESYGVLDDSGVLHSVSHFDPPFAQSNPEFVDSIVYFLARLKTIAPDLHIMGNEGDMYDESMFPKVWSGFDGTMREDILVGFGSDSASRNTLHQEYTRYQWEGSAGKVAILQALIPNDSTFREKLRTAYVEYLIFRGPNFFFGPTFIGPTNAGVPISDYAQMQQALGLPTGPATDSQCGGDPGSRLYSRNTSNGIVYLNWSGQTMTITLSSGRTYFDRNGHQVTKLIVPDLSGDYVLFNFRH